MRQREIAITNLKLLMSVRTIEWPILRRGLSREEAAIYLGISPSKFDELRKNGRVGPAKLIDGRKVWDIRALDEAFDSFPTEAGEAEGDWRVLL
jgi:hypothetical protein